MLKSRKEFIKTIEEYGFYCINFGVKCEQENAKINWKKEKKIQRELLDKIMEMYDDRT